MVIFALQYACDSRGADRLTLWQLPSPSVACSAETPEFGAGLAGIRPGWLNKDARPIRILPLLARHLGAKGKADRGLVLGSEA
jgi:hypothetical protein